MSNYYVPKAERESKGWPRHDEYYRLALNYGGHCIVDYYMLARSIGNLLGPEVMPFSVANPESSK